MGVTAPVLGKRASYADYLALADGLRAEYVDGEVLVNPPPSYLHQMICLRLRDLLLAGLPGALVVVAAGWQMAADSPQVRIPGVAVLAAEPQGALISEAPLVVIEVLSTSRHDDLVRKSGEYLGAGVGQYWVLDPRDQVFDIFGHADHKWALLAHLTRENPTAAVRVAHLGSVTVSLGDILPP